MWNADGPRKSFVPVDSEITWRVTHAGKAPSQQTQLARKYLFSATGAFQAGHNGSGWKI